MTSEETSKMQKMHLFKDGTVIYSLAPQAVSELQSAPPVNITDLK